MAKTNKVSNKQNKDKSKKKRLAIALGITIPVVLAGAATGIVFGLKACKKTTREVEVDDGSKDQTNITTNTTSSGDLEITISPKDTSKAIDNVKKITIGNTELQPTDYTFDKATGKITIKKEVLDKNPGKVIVEPAIRDKTVSGIKLSIDTKEINVNDEFEINATLSYELNKDEDITWTLDQQDIVSLSTSTSKSGVNIKVTGLKAGTAVLTAECNGHSDKCSITVKDKKATGIEFTQKQDTVVEGESFNAIAKLTYANADIITWEQSGEGKVSFNPETTESGKSTTITGVSKGTIKITARCGDLSKSFDLSVTPKTVSEFTSITFKGEASELNKAVPGESFTPDKLYVQGKLSGETTARDLNIEEHYTVTKDGSDITEAIVKGTYKLPTTAGKYTFAVVSLGQGGLSKQFNIEVVEAVKITKFKVGENVQTALGATLSFLEELEITPSEPTIYFDLESIQYSTKGKFVVYKTEGTNIGETDESEYDAGTSLSGGHIDVTDWTGLTSNDELTIDFVEDKTYYKTCSLTPDKTTFTEAGIELYEDKYDPIEITNNPIGTSKACFKLKTTCVKTYERRFTLTIDLGTAGQIDKIITVSENADTFDVEFTTEEWRKISDKSEFNLQPRYIPKECAIVSATDFTDAFKTIDIPASTFEGSEDPIEIACTPNDTITGEIYLAPSSSPTTSLISTGETEFTKDNEWKGSLTIPKSAWANVKYGDKIEVHFKKTEAVKTKIDWSKAQGFDTPGITIKDGTTEFDDESKTITIKYDSNFEDWHEIDEFKSTIQLLDSDEQVVYTSDLITFYNYEEGETTSFEITDTTGITPGSTLTPKLIVPKVAAELTCMGLPNILQGKISPIVENSECSALLQNNNPKDIPITYKVVNSKQQEVMASTSITLKGKEEFTELSLNLNWDKIEDGEELTLTCTIDGELNFATIEYGEDTALEDVSVSLPGEKKTEEYTVKSTIWNDDTTYTFQATNNTGADINVNVILFEVSSENTIYLSSSPTKLTNGVATDITIPADELDWSSIEYHELTLILEEAEEKTVNLDSTEVKANFNIDESTPIPEKITDSSRTITFNCRPTEEVGAGTYTFTIEHMGDVLFTSNEYEFEDTENFVTVTIVIDDDTWAKFQSSWFCELNFNRKS